MLKKLTISSHTIARIYGVVKPFRTPYKIQTFWIIKFIVSAHSTTLITIGQM